MSDPAAYDIATLVDAARGARAKAHAPYSRFAVGAAVVLTDGTIVQGANMENASYGLSLCAETVAVASASAMGRLGDIAAIAVVGAPLDGGAPGALAMPCGRCRQVLAEAQATGQRPITVHCAATEGAVDDDSVASYRLDELLPHAFGANDMTMRD